VTEGDRRENLARTRPSLRRVELFEIAAPRIIWKIPRSSSRRPEEEKKPGGRFHPRLNKSESPIAHKYREGKMQSTPKGEFKVLEIVKRETIEPVYKKRPASKLSPAASSRPERGGTTSGRTFRAVRSLSASLSENNTAEGKRAGKARRRWESFFSS